MKGKWHFVKNMLGVGLALLLCMICFSAPVAAQAAETSDTCGENVTFVFDEATGTLTISGEGAMKDFAYSGAPWYSFRSKISNVVIEDGVTSIGDYAFNGCGSLTEITIPDGVTSIGTWAFYNCSSLTEVTIPDGVTSIGDYAFAYCSSLTEITIPDSVTSIGDYVFLSCSSLTEVTIPDSVTSIGDSAFYNCSSLTEVTIPDSVTSIGRNAFAGWSSLTEITIPDSVTSMGDYVFYNCRSLTEVTIGDSVTSIGNNAFYDCKSLTEVTIPDSVTSIGDYAFFGCSALTEITIPDSVTSIGYFVFNGCNKLTTINLGCKWKADIDSGNFYGATKIETINMHHVGDACFTADDTEKSITSTCEACGVVFGTVTLLDPDADAKIMYDGTSKTTKYEGEIPGETPVITYTGVTATNGEAVKAGTYTATMTVGGKSVSVQFVIEKLEWAPNVPQKTVTVPYTLTKVKDVVLPEGWAWQKSYTDLDLMVGEVTVATAVYNGADKGNYKNEAVMIEITRSACVHEGGVATCVEKATCDVCGEQYGELDTANHGEEEVCNQSEASCTVNGYTGDTCCADCGTVLEQGEAIEAKGHIGGTATCVEKAACEVCGEQYGDVDATNHGEEELKNQTEATCVADGYAGDTYCKDCDTVLVTGEVIAAKGHGETEVRDQSEKGFDKNGYTGDTYCKDCGILLETGVEIPMTSGSCRKQLAWEYDEETKTLTISGEGEMGDFSYSDVNRFVPWKNFSADIEKVVIEDGVTNVGPCAFCDSKNIAEVVIPNSVTSIESSAFLNCSGLKEIVIPDSVTSIGDFAFKNCTDLAVVTLPDSVTSIGKQAFSYCSLTEIAIPNGLTTISDYAFSNNFKLTKVVIPDSVTTISYCAFYRCTGLTEITIPDSVTSIGNNAFYDATNLTTINLSCIWKDKVETGNFCGAENIVTANYSHGDEELCNQSDATCTEAGYTGDTCCKACGTVLVAGETIAAKGHVGGTATCVEKAACEVCGEKYGELDSANHGEKELRNQTEATCTEEGYTGDTCCADCGTVLVAGEAIIATGHEYKSEVTKEPTTAENGVRTYTCTNCGDTYTEEIDKLPASTCGITAEVTYASHWGNGGQVEITLTNEAESLLDGWNIELDLNIDAKLTNTWGDGYVTSFEDGHVCITNQSWVTGFEAGVTKKVYLQYEGTLPNLVTCVKSDDVLVSRINYLNHWGNGGQIEICLENLGDALNGSWGTELDINLIGTMTNTWGDGYVTSYENGHIVIENQSWVTSFEAGATKSVWLQYDGVLPVYASNAVIK